MPIFHQFDGPTTKLFGRYIDDCLGATSCTKEEFERFIGFANSFHPALKFTWEISETSVSFLDINISVQGNNLANSQCCLVTVLIFPPISRQRLNSTDTPNFSGFVDSAAMIQTSTPHAMKCLISFRNVAILTLSYPKHSIVSKTSLENSPWNRQPQILKNEFLSHLLSTLTNSRQKRGPQKF